MINLAFFFLTNGLDFFLHLHLFHERIIFHESWEQILYKFNTFCVQHMDIRLFGLQRNNRFFEILTQMDN